MSRERDLEILLVRCRVHLQAAVRGEPRLAKTAGKLLADVDEALGEATGEEVSLSTAAGKPLVAGAQVIDLMAALKASLAAKP